VTRVPWAQGPRPPEDEPGASKPRVQVIHLNWQPMLATALLTTALLPVVGAAPVPQCSPQAAPAQQLQTDPVTYERVYSAFGRTYVELWQETNGVSGLQPDNTWNCGSPGDTQISSRCIGRDCPATVI